MTATPKLLATTLALAMTSPSLLAQNTTPTEIDSRERESVAVTIYNDSLALIRETRNIPLAQGANRVALRDVSAHIMPETASLSGKSGAALHLIEQNFDFDLLSERALLNKYVGKKVTVIRTHPASGEESREEATVLANNEGLTLQYADRIESGLPRDARIAFADVPANLRDRPTLLVDLHADKAGTQNVDLAYLTSGLSWQADYVATLARDEKSLNLAGWVTLVNQSGTRYDNAALQLVAGDVNRAPDLEYDQAVRYMEDAVPLAAAPKMAQEEFFEYHLYSLDRPTTIADNQRKQVSLLSAANIPVAKEYRLQGAQDRYYQIANNSPELGDKRKVDVFVEFANKEESQLGMPLPKGVMRVYKNDSQDRPLFVGEDRIDHTAKNDNIRLKLGNAFDLSGIWKQKEYKVVEGKLGPMLSRDYYEARYDIELSNAKKEDVVIKVVEPIPGNWEILEESHQHEKPSAHLAQWQIPVSAEGKATLSYKIRVSF
ncbi:MAG: DUF4139 domain-containing protein [Cardiobacteriaceae bacterium]|nr:DUF4139 domain-containing protein [Cardiobacteriaceae bacterium]